MDLRKERLGSGIPAKSETLGLFLLREVKGVSMVGKKARKKVFSLYFFEISDNSFRVNKD
jgi:hypothetical protein